MLIASVVQQLQVIYQLMTKRQAPTLSALSAEKTPSNVATQCSNDHSMYPRAHLSKHKLGI